MVTRGNPCNCGSVMPSVHAVSAGGRQEVAGLCIAKVVIPTEAQIVYPGGVRGPGPTGGEELGAHLADAIKLRQRVIRVIAAGRVAATVEVASSERVVVGGVIIHFADPVIDRKRCGLAGTEDYVGVRVIIWAEVL